MVFVITEWCLPPNKADEAGKIGLEALKKYPYDKSISKMVAQMIFTEKDGLVHVNVVAKCKQEKMKEAMDIAFNRCIMAANMVESLRYQVYFAYELPEAMPLIGLQAPAPQE